MLDLRVWNRNALIVRSYESQRTGDAIEQHAKTKIEYRMYECVTGKQRNLDDLAPIAPPSYLGQQWLVNGDTLFLQFRDHFLFVPRTSAYRIPASFLCRRVRD